MVAQKAVSLMKGPWALFLQLASLVFTASSLSVVSSQIGLGLAVEKSLEQPLCALRDSL